MIKHALTFVLALGLTSPALSDEATRADSDELAIEYVRELPRNETSEGHLFHAGHLWVAQARQADGEKHKVLIYDEHGAQIIATVELEHSVTEIVAHGAASVVIAGKQCCPWRTGYSVISLAGGKATVKTTWLPERYQVVNVATAQGELFFSEPGERSILAKKGGGLTALTTSVSGPGAMASVSGALWAVEQKSFQLGDENLVRIELGGRGIRRALSSSGLGITDLIALEDLGLVAFNEIGRGHVAFLKADTMEYVGEAAVASGPRGMTRLGRCLVVASEEAKQITFIDVTDAAFPVVAAWDITAAGDRLKKPRKVAVNERTGEVFVRSSYVCPTCQATQSSVVRVSERSGETLARCAR